MPQGGGEPAPQPPPHNGEPVIAYAKIYPGIGFARVGNSPDEFILGPEVPGRPVDADGRFKDRQGRIKRQAARFRIYAFDAEGNVEKELTAAEADITWTVHLANKKAVWHQFHGAAAEAAADKSGTPLPLRNASVTDRESLIIDPGPRSIAGPAQPRVRFDTGTFQGIPVELGELRTDEAGRLLVLGGLGRSESPTAQEIVDYANNDGWFDDTSDGPVTAKVVLKNGQEVPVKAGSWVSVAPPDYAPAVQNLVTLYDVQVEVARAAGWVEPPQRISFTRDVFPILSRSVGMRWVNDQARRGHGQGSRGDLINQDTLLPLLASNDTANRSERRRVFERLRDPGLTGEEAVAQANLRFMPHLSGDGGFTTTGVPRTWLSILRHQYEVMHRWAEGDFDADWAGEPAVPSSLAHLPLAEQPHALDRAASEACAGGGFLPGIEMTYIARDPSWYAEPHRLRPGLEPGDVTKRMAVPWQADFYECASRWWPAQRPDDVVAENEFDSVLAAYGLDGTGDGQAPPPPPYEALRFATVRWDRGLRQGTREAPALGDLDMVTAWSELGIVRPRPLPGAGPVMVEGERRAYFRVKDREYFHIMMNLESYPDFLPKARQLAEDFLADARKLQQDKNLPDRLRPFVYSTPVFRSRLDQIYTDMARAAEAFSHPSEITKEFVVHRIVQMAPFNQIDGAWLRDVARLGPLDEVHALLFHVFSDELGNGDPKLNHANLYTDLLHSLGVYLPPVASRAYIENEDIVDEAFTAPLFQLVMGEFAEEFLPEVLGMTLFLEWGAISMKAQAKMLEAFGIDPKYYTLHVGIDNSTTGHGAMARRAVEIYLEEIRATSGDRAMQETWRRIWDGYVAFATTGSLGAYFRNLVLKPPVPADEVAKMIRRKAHIGQQNHGSKLLGGNPINAWFDQPRGFMVQLQKAGYIIPGNVEESPFFDLLKPTGPMFRVFTDDEIQIWENWTRSLADPAVPSFPETDEAKLMEHMVRTLKSRQQGVPGHRVNQLTGKTPDGAVTKPVSWWFEREPAEFLEALADPMNGWVVPGDPAASLLITERASGDHPMARVLGEVAPGTNHKTWRSIAIDWIAKGCPLPRRQPSPAPPAPAVTPSPLAAETLTEDAPGTAVTAATAALAEDARATNRVELMDLFQNETWLPEYADVPLYGNGALH